MNLDRLLEEALAVAKRVALALEEIADELAQQRVDRRQEAQTVVRAPVEHEWPQRES